jgi:hypothetical protein
MNCTSCQSNNQAELASEMMLHFSGLLNIDHPGIPVFPNVLVCLDCGASLFAIPQAELTLLASRAAISDRQLQGAQSVNLRTLPGMTD